ncbi:MAG: hypothetical protein ACOCXP_01445 [Candidatus Dojkabacteria bacterium]
MSDQILLGVTLLIVAVFVVLAISYYFAFIFRSKPAKWKIELETRIRKLEARGFDQERKLLEYDKLLGWTLQKKFFSDDSIGSLLKSHKDKFSKVLLNDLWEAHKLRNKLAHDVDFHPGKSEINKAVIILKRYLQKQASS